MSKPPPSAPTDASSPLMACVTLWDGRVRQFRLEGHADPRGVLSALSFARLPLVPRRMFWINQVAAGTVRGGHAHRSATQLLLRMEGEIHVECRHGGERHTLVLDAERPALLIAPGVWSQQTYLRATPVLLVLSDADFDPASYIHDQAGHGR